MIDRGIAGQNPRIDRRSDTNREAGIVQVTGNHVAIAPVVALPHADENWAVDTQSLQQIDTTSTGVLHQHQAGQAMIAERPRVALTGLITRQGGHRTGHAI